MDKHPYMLDPITGKHHRIDNDPNEPFRIYIHYPNTCTLVSPEAYANGREPFDKRATAIPTRVVPSRYGWVLVCYETRGLITFFVQINNERAAWQRIEWDANFQKSWDEGRVNRAIENFLHVAVAEVKGKVQPNKLSK